ncbi:40S ribosomal protein S23-like [Platysternon megacephalum]|uniref:40S ribosomal protein S23-like n=1 Tax=Platysternon megacephalum TaxID=55544 RepID=A0A4D9DJN7_9SAUR|nr:40S ribosomal protein S23-like [Platysternon megacephalum]
MEASLRGKISPSLSLYPFDFSVVLRSPEVSEIFQSQPLVEGSHVAFSCFIAGYFPQELTVTWLRRESGDSVATPIEDSADYAIIHKETCAKDRETYQQMVTLSFTPSAQRDQGAEFICQVGHLALQTPIERSTGMLEVKGVATPDAKEVAPDTREVTPVFKEVAPVSREVTPVFKEVAPVSREVTPVFKEVAPVSREVTPVFKEVAPVSREVTPVFKEVAPVSREVTPVFKEVAPVSREVTPVFKEVAPVSREVTPVFKEVAPVSREVTPVFKEVAPVSREVTPVSKEVAPVSREVTPVSKEVAPDSREFKPISREGRGSAAGRKETHFVDRHREQLIQRVTLVEGVLDKLLGDVLDTEQYLTITAERTNPMKMRKLYEFMVSWNKYCKDQLYEALKDKCKFLVADLEGD